MATKRFIVEIEEGCTICDNCPIEYQGYCSLSKIAELGLDCDVLNLATLKIKEYEKE